MPTFREQLRAASQEPPVVGGTRTRWDDVFKEFVEFLSEAYGHFLVARVRDSAAPGVRRLVCTPKGHRNEPFVMMIIHATASAVRVLGSTTVEFKSDQEFRDHLLDFIKRPTFKESLGILEEKAMEPVVGVLRSGEMKLRRPSLDVAVKVEADQQHLLADASEATPRRRVEAMYVAPADRKLLEGQGKYTEQTKPRWLVAGGYALEIDRDGDRLEPDGRIRLEGMPVDPEALE